MSYLKVSALISVPFWNYMAYQDITKGGSRTRPAFIFFSIALGTTFGLVSSPIAIPLISLVLLNCRTLKYKEKKDCWVIPGNN